MTVSADDVASTLRLLIPGFVALKLFYVFAHRTKRADWEWGLWSVLLSAPLAIAATAIAGFFGAKPVDAAGAFAECGVKESVGKVGTDLQAALKTCADAAITSQNADLRFWIALALAVLVGLLGVVAWRGTAKVAPRLLDRAALEAWDAVLSRPHWVQIKVDELVYSGKVDVVADPVETDDLDVYITHPALIVGSTVVPLDATAGVLIARDKIDWIQVLKPAN